jgi:hypothetical protein
MMNTPAALLLLVASALAAEDDSGARTLVKTGQFFFPRLQFQCVENLPDKWDAWPIGDQRLRDAVKAMTNVNILTDPVAVNLDHPDQLFQHPFVFMTSEAHFKLSDGAARNLREYLLRGGFLYADDCVWNQTNESLFYASFTSEMKRIFPDQVVREVPDGHEIFSCFYKLERIPWVQGEVHPAMGVFDRQTGRLMAMCTSGDLHCGWVGFPNLNQESCKDCIRMGVNIVVYCLSH